jgi:hypothetical protein
MPTAVTILGDTGGGYKRARTADGRDVLYNPSTGGIQDPTTRAYLDQGAVSTKIDAPFPPATPNYTPEGMPTMTPGAGTKRILVQFRQGAGPTAISGISNALGGVPAEQMGSGMVAFTVPAAQADDIVARLGTNPSVAAASAEGGRTAVTQTTRAGPDVAAPILSGQQPTGPQAPGFDTPVDWGGAGQEPRNLWDIWNGGAGPKTRAPNPWQVNPAVWDSMGETGQQLALSFAEDEGWDANDYQRQINATRPQGRAPRASSFGFTQPRRL